MLNRIRKWFSGPTPEEAYVNGEETTDKLLAEGKAAGRDPALVAQHIFAMGFGSFNKTASDRAFDRGIQDRLHELGFTDSESRPC
ncbi:hypothetical protein D3C87_1901410 [compost metagenome]